MKTPAFLLIFALMIGGGWGACQTRTIVPPAPSETKSQPALATADLLFRGTIEANALAANYGLASVPDGNAKVAVKGPIGVITNATAGYATQKQKDEAMVPVMLALQGKIDQAEARWVKSSAEAEALKATVTRLEQTVKAERVSAAAELTRQLQSVRDEEQRKAAAEERKLISLIFFGGGALLIAAAAAIFIYASEVPQFGPKVALGTGLAGVALIGSGIAILQLLSHPWVIWVGVSVAGMGLTIGIVTLWHNHKVAIEQGQIIPSPAPNPIVAVPQEPQRPSVRLT